MIAYSYRTTVVGLDVIKVVNYWFDRLCNQLAGLVFHSHVVRFTFNCLVLFGNHYSLSPTDNHRDTNLNRNICGQVSLVWIHKFNRLVFKLYFTKYGSLSG